MQRSGTCDFMLKGAVMERWNSYKYLGLVLHATKGLHFGTEALMAVARKALLLCGDIAHSWAYRIQLFTASYLTLWCCPF